MSLAIDTAREVVHRNRKSKGDTSARFAPTKEKAATRTGGKKLNAEDLKEIEQRMFDILTYIYSVSKTSPGKLYIREEP